VQSPCEGEDVARYFFRRFFELTWGRERFLTDVGAFGDTWKRNRDACCDQRELKGKNGNLSCEACDGPLLGVLDRGKVVLGILM